MIFDEIFENMDTGFSADFQQVIRGEDGHTPVKGTDYWTEGDKAEMVADVVEELAEQNMDSGALRAHIADKQNPHNVTTQQIGAAPMSELGDVYALFSRTHLLEFYDPEATQYIDQNGNYQTRENCTLYCIPVMNDNCAELRGKRVSVKTYAFDDMSYGLGSGNPSGETNTNANIEEDPQSGIWEFAVEIPENFSGLFLISFCQNDYLDVPQIAISQGTVWEAIKALQYFRDNLADYLPIYNGEVL